MNRPTILVVRSDDSFSRFLRESGFDVLNLEMIKTAPVVDVSELAKVIDRIDEYDGIFITSPVAAELFVERLKIDAKTYSGKVYVLGERARNILHGLDLNVITSENANTARELIESFDDAAFAGKNLLFVRGDRSVRTIPRMLEGKAKVDELTVYRTVESKLDRDLTKDIKDRIGESKIEWVCFFSPSGVASFIRYFGNEDLTKIKGAAIGETTAAAARGLGVTIDFISQRATAEDFAAGLAAYIENIE